MSASFSNTCARPRGEQLLRVRAPRRAPGQHLNVRAHGDLHSVNVRPLRRGERRISVADVGVARKLLAQATPVGERRAPCAASSRRRAKPRRRRSGRRTGKRRREQTARPHAALLTRRVPCSCGRPSRARRPTAADCRASSSASVRAVGKDCARDLALPPGAGRSAPRCGPWARAFFASATSCFTFARSKPPDIGQKRRRGWEGSGKKTE